MELNNLGTANPKLCDKTNYSYTDSNRNLLLNDCQYSDDELSDSDILSTYIDINDYLQTDDDIILDYIMESIHPQYDYHQIATKPISNIFMHHPHFNINNKEYQWAMNSFVLNNKYIKPQDVSQPIKIDVPISTITIPIKNPGYPAETINVTAAADSGSDIEAIGINAIIHYKQKGMIKYHKTGIDIGTGGGKVHINKYVPLTVKSKDGKEYDRKFWCLESLPTHDFLIGRHLMHKLGWILVNKYHVWEHKPHNIDHIDTELDDLLCTKYPYKGEPDIDISKVKVKDPELAPFIHEQLQEHKDVLAKHEWDSGQVKHLNPFRIEFIDEDHPYKQGFISKEYWTNPKEKEEMLRQIEGMISYGQIEECKNPRYVSPIFCVPKKTGDVRIVFDYRKINEITKKHMYPIPKTSGLFEKFRGKRYITSLDLKGGYWHIPIHEDDKHKTAFIFDGKIYQWNVMPFGPTNAPMYFQQCMREIFGDLDFVTIYLDDISILSDTLEEHKTHLKIIFERLKIYCIKLRLDKCIWGVDETQYLGFHVDKVGTKCKADYIQKIMDIPLPVTRTDLKRFIGMIQFLHSFIPQLQDDMSVLSKLTSTKRDGNKIIWNDVSKASFYRLKEMVQSVEPLVHPNLDKQFHVFTDASKYGIGGMIAQYDDQERLRPVAYCSKVFNDTQTRWHVSEQEVYAAIYCVEKWSHYLRHQKFILHTDHKNLQKLFNTAVNFKSGKLFRWAVRLQDYHFECQYIPGKKNVFPDYLSRESVMVQKSDHEIVNKFYRGKHKNKIREEMSNNGGVDILTLYTNHLYITTLNDNIQDHYLSHSDPYQSLLESKPTNTPLPNNVSINTLKFLGIDDKDIRFNELLNPYNQNNYSEFDHIIQCILNNDDIDNKLIQQFLPIDQSFRDQVSGDDGDDQEFNWDRDIYKPQYPRRTEVHDESGRVVTKRKLRRSKRIKQKTFAKSAKPVKVNLKIDTSSPLSNKQLKPSIDSRINELIMNGEIQNKHQKRENTRKKFKEKNQKLIDAAPCNLTWNKHLLLGSEAAHTIISDDYSINMDKGDKFPIGLIRYKQWEDPICYAIICFLKTGTNLLIRDLPAYIKRYILSGRFAMDENDVLIYQHTQSCVQLKVMPSTLLTSLLKRVHGSMHDGDKKMLLYIRDTLKYWWPKMRQHIRIYCQCCNTCQHIKGGKHSQYKRGGMKLYIATRPFEQISVDIVGPLPTSHSGNRYIVTMIDKFTRYCMLVPVPDITALTVVKAIDRWITTFGPPESILSDNGPQFISSIYRDYMKNHNNIKYKYTTTYHPQCNGQIERLHRWIKERLSLLAYDGGLNFVTGKDDWSDYLSIIQYAYNSTPNKMTSYAPMHMVFGKIPTKISEYEFDPNQPQTYIDYLIRRQTIIKQNATEKQRIYDEMRMKTHNKKRSTKNYEIGDHVLWNINIRFQGNKKKLGPRWVGPYEVIDIFNEGQNYKLRVLPLPPAQSKNPMNPHKPPKRAHPTKDRLHGDFIVPREQIKPYYTSYESQFDGLMSPLDLSMELLSIQIQENTIKLEQNIPCYYRLFHIFHEETTQGIAPYYYDPYWI